jgi:hypothetical protein
MGTEITLEFDGLTLDWSKNNRGSDHGMLFQERDRKRMRSDQIDYQYFEEHDEDPAVMEMAFCRSLKEVVPRLNLLGFTLEHAKREYEERREACRQEREEMANDDENGKLDILDFGEFVSLATGDSVQSLDDTFVASVDRDGERVVRGRFKDRKLWDRLPHSWEDDEWGAYSERSYFGRLIAVVHPYSVLRVLAENETNLAGNVAWQYGLLVEGGYAYESEFTASARRTQTFLVATEGSSDAYVLKHALALLRPEIADFFRFIDVSERHPFSGAGNLLKFAEGLAKIDVHNQIVLLFDNDAEGFDAYQKVSGLTLPTNMRAMILPELGAFRSFPAQGPEGIANADINRRAAAMECYLDLDYGRCPRALVVWTNFKKELGVYQGSLESKESFTKTFLQITPKTIAEGGYRVEKLHGVLDALVSECSAIAMHAQYEIE